MNEKLTKVRNIESGLFDGVDYSVDEMGFIDWKSMVPSKFFAINKFNFESRGEDIPEKIEDVSEDDLFITLAGIKHIARFRGIEKVDFQVISSNEESVVTKCSIDWIPNLENPLGASFSELGSANKKNVNSLGFKYLEAISANRAFTRCVRNFLNINILGEEEVSSSGTDGKSKQDKKAKPEEVDGQPKNQSHEISPQGILEKICYDHNIQLEGLWEYLSDDVDKELLVDVKSFGDIPVKISRKLLKSVKQAKATQKKKV
jgi:hypothetical protein